MATSLDLQEQEQLDAVKAFWNKYGDLITWVLVLVLGGFGAWNGWQWYQRDQGNKAGALFDELDRAATAGDADKAGQAFADLRQRYPGTAYAQQGGLLAAKAQFEKGKADDARASLTWVAEQAKEAEARTVARLRLAALQAEAKQYDEALKTLDAAKAEGFEALVADRRGDVLMLQGKKAEARNAWTVAYAAMSEKVEYRRLIDAKLTALGAAPGAASAPAAGVAAAASAAASIPASPAARPAVAASAAASK
ncbi:MAG: tetratricopeptide repeat protein [Burkholderiales bacterium]|nr:tetratricopeptide repeat protein [Burkholderiales bacterium]